MFEMTIPEPVLLESIVGSQLTEDDGTPSICSFEQFLLGRLADPIFYLGLTGIEAAELGLATRQAIKDGLQGRSPGETLALENDPTIRLQRVIRTPQAPIRQDVAPCLVPHMRAVLDAQPAKPAEPAKP